MKLPVTCEVCNRDGTFVVDYRVVVHPHGECVLPPRVDTVTVPRDRYPSPWKMKLRG